MSGSVLLTRPIEDSQVLADVIHAELNLPAFIEPMLTIQLLQADLPEPDSYDNLIFTSANAVRVFSGQTRIRDKKVYVVGNNTAQEASAAGFQNIVSACGNIQDLMTLVQNTENLGPFLYVRGRETSINLLKTLSSFDITLKEVIVYEAKAATSFTEALLRELENQVIEYALFFSKRTAETFVSLAQEHGLEDHMRTIKALCISESVINCLSVLPWKHTYVSDTPDRQGMVSLLGRVLKDHKPE